MLAVTLRENAITTLDALKTSLGIDPAEEDAQRDATLVQLINAASAWLETQLGRKLGKSTYRQKYCGTGTQMLSLEQYPIVSVERITDTFTGETITDFDFNETGEIGVLFREDGWTFRGHIGGLAYDYIAPRQRKFTENSFKNRLKFAIWFDGMGLLVYHIFMCEYSFWGNKMARTFAILKNHEV